MQFENKSADELYQEGRSRWMEIVDLSLYDDLTVIRNATVALQKAIDRNPDHVASLKLLSSILMENDIYEEAQEMVQKLTELEPEVIEHKVKLAVLQTRNRDHIKNYVESRLLIPDR